MTTGAAARLALAVRLFPPATLDGTMALADLQTRVDRKYVVQPASLDQILASLRGRVAALDIQGRRLFAYESVYFDTPDRASYLGAAHRRRRRFKVRTRTYLDSGRCVLEVKERNGRGATVKHRLPYPAADRRRLTPAGRAFVASHVGDLGCAAALEPSLTTRYLRATLVDTVDGVRLTLDADLRCTSQDGSRLTLDDRFIVETKSPGPATRADRLLWAAGHRPLSISKYGVGMAGLDRSLPANKWHRVLGRYFGRRPAGSFDQRRPAAAVS